MKMYSYAKCGTCVKAKKFLEEHQIKYQEIPIRETPPSIGELKKMLKWVGELKKLFNTSGQDYRKMNRKEKLPQLSDQEALKLLSENGNLVKRPFVVGKNDGWVGFKEDIWREKLGL